LSVKIRWFSKGVLDAAKAKDLIIVVDTLRCSSTIATALELGVSAIYPVSSVKEAFKLKETGKYANKYGNPLLMGEVESIKVKGFDLGNSPSELLLRSDLKGRSVLLRTSAGSQALIALSKVSKGANKIKAIISCILNAHAVAKFVSKLALKEKKDISMVCCGFQAREFALEDFLGAGAIISQIHKRGLEKSDEAIIASLAFENLANSLSKVLSETKSGRRLKETGQSKDIDFCSQLNKFNGVPIFDGKAISL
jgi:2-phosphosulfolactate phosphatase